jgi:hypothetical protein
MQRAEDHRDDADQDPVPRDVNPMTYAFLVLRVPLMDEGTFTSH